MHIKYFIFFIGCLFILNSCQNGNSQTINEEEIPEENGFDYPEESVHNDEEQDEITYDPLISFRDEPNYVQPTLDKSKYKWEDEYAIIDWADLSRVVYENKQISIDTLLMSPIYHDEIKALDGVKVQIKGYLIPFPLDEKDKHMEGNIHFFSANPMSQCFFCGAAGPESVMDVLTDKKHNDFKMDQIATFRGILYLNDTEMDNMNYILKDAELMNISK